MVPRAPLSVLVLCTGNICRSPIAEVILASKLAGIPGLSITSAGLGAPIGVRPDPFALQAASELGYRIDEGKRSRQVMRPELEAATLILVMETLHKQEVRRLAPPQANKTFLLGQWSIGEIADPIGRDYEFFRRVAREIEEAAATWLPRVNLLTGSNAV